MSQDIKKTFSLDLTQMNIYLEKEKLKSLKELIEVEAEKIKNNKLFPLIVETIFIYINSNSSKYPSVEIKTIKKLFSEIYLFLYSICLLNKNWENSKYNNSNLLEFKSLLESVKNITETWAGKPSDLKEISIIHKNILEEIENKYLFLKSKE